MGASKISLHVLWRSGHQGFAAQATYWSAVDLHKTVMTTVCEALGRPVQGAHPEEVTALAAKADLLTAGVAVDDCAKVTVEHEATLVYEASPWAADKRAAEIVRPAPVQSADWVPPKSLARDMAFAKLQIEDPVSCGGGEGFEATQRHASRATGYHAQCGRTRHWHVLDCHAQITDRPGTECAVEDGNGAATWRDARCRPAFHVCSAENGDTCEQSLAEHPFHPFCCQYGGASTRPHRAVQCTLRRLIEQAGGYADVDGHVPELHDWVSNDTDAAPKVRCAILDVVSWFPGVLPQRWMDVSVRCPHAERYNESASKPGVAAVAEETEKTKRCGTAVRPLVFETCGRLGGEGSKLLRDDGRRRTGSAAHMQLDDGETSSSGYI